MARQEEDREDLLAEATGLAERIELELAGCGASLVAGFRRSDCASFFFGPDPVYQFNSQRQLRRVFAGGVLYKAERGRLVSLTRTRDGGRLELVASEVAPAEQTRLLSEMAARFEQLREALAGGDFKILGQVPAGADVVGRVRVWLDAAGSAIDIAASPHAR